MQRRILVAAVLALGAITVFTGTRPAIAGDAPPLVWVALENADAVALVNVRTGNVLRRVRTAGGPHNITVATDGTAVVALWASDDIAIVRRRARIVDLGGAPHDVKMRGGLIVVANQGAARLERVRSDGRVLRPIGLKADPHDLAVQPNGRRAWVTLEGSDDLAVVNLDTRSVRYVSTGQSPHDLLFAPDGRLWVTDWNGALHVFDGRRRIETLRFGREAHHLAFTPDGEEAWITDHGVGKVFILSVRRIRRIDSRRIPGSPHHVAITANGRWAVIADHDRGDLLVFDAETHRRARVVRVGAGPHGVWAVPAST
jgi:streptogramin lyase